MTEEPRIASEALQTLLASVKVTVCYSKITHLLKWHSWGSTKVNISADNKQTNNKKQKKRVQTSISHLPKMFSRLPRLWGNNLWTGETKV